MTTRMRAPRTPVVAAMFGVLLWGATARADEEKAIRPELEQMVQTLAEKLEAAADKLELTAEQRTKIRELHATWAEKFKGLRTERRSLLGEELKALGTILSPEQREKAKELVEDRVEMQEQPRAQGLPRFVAARATLAERLQSAADKLDLTPEQRKQITEALSSHAVQHIALRAKCRDALEDEFKAVAEILTPEQRKKARECLEVRMLHAAAAKSVADRLHDAAEKLGLSADQKQQIAKAHVQYAGKYLSLRSERKELLRDELKSVAAILTPEQREMVKDICEDRVVIVDISASGRDVAEAAKALRETVSDRLEALADKLGLSPNQRTEIREAHAAYAAKFEAQREKRKALRKEELQALGAILTAEQKEKVKDFIEDRSEI